MTPPDKANEIVETPLTTVTGRIVDVEVSKLLESLGLNIAVRETFPSETGVQVQVADVLEALDEPQPEIVTPSNRKFTVPARETVAVIVTAPLSAALVAEFGREIEIEVVAFATVIDIAFTPDCDPLSVATTLKL